MGATLRAITSPERKKQRPPQPMTEERNLCRDERRCKPESGTSGTMRSRDIVFGHRASRRSCRHRMSARRRTKEREPALESLGDAEPVSRSGNTLNSRSQASPGADRVVIPCAATDIVIQGRNSSLMPGVTRWAGRCDTTLLPFGSETGPGVVRPRGRWAAAPASVALCAPFRPAEFCDAGADRQCGRSGVVTSEGVADQPEMQSRPDNQILGNDRLGTYRITVSPGPSSEVEATDSACALSGR